MAKKSTTPKAMAPGVGATTLKPAAPKKSAKAPTPAAKAPARVKSAPAAASQVTTDDIALRAYFIAEKRQKKGLPGDSTSDWVEAERQLKAEARP